MHTSLGTSSATVALYDALKTVEFVCLKWWHFDVNIVFFTQGILYQAGDIVSIEDIEGDLYYAQLRGFVQDQYAQKSAVITWLIPVVARPSHFDPALFLPGNTVHGMAIAM